MTSSAALAQEVPDPWEPVNRAIFDFNDFVDVHALEPIARGYTEVTPDPVEESVAHFFRNLRYPRYLVSDLVQLKFEQALHHTGRFLINSTLGVAGLFDVAKHVGLADHEEDFGSALGYWGVGTGPYMVLPFLGPSNVRDTVGTVVDLALDPFYFLDYFDATDLHWAISGGETALKVVDTRAGLLDAVESAKESSVDYYLFSRGAFQQYREGVIHDGKVPARELSLDEEAEEEFGVE